MPNQKLTIAPQFSNLFVDRLFMTQEALMAELHNLHFGEQTGYYEVEIPTYSEEAKELACRISSEQLSVTTEFNETDIPDKSIALHLIKGTIYAENPYWWSRNFSTKQFVQDIKAAEKNPQIIAHVLFINSGGGEAWYLEKALSAVRDLRKPVIGYIEKYCCSAAYYIGCGSGRLFTTSINDTIGSIGTMISFLDIIPYFEAMGAKWIEEYADQSKLKNKDINDLRNDKPKKYKEKWLNPLAAQFIQAVRDAREQLAALDEKHDVFAGDAYSAKEALSIGLIDEIADMDIALQYAMDEGLKWKDKVDKQHRVSTYID